MKTENNYCVGLTVLIVGVLLMAIPIPLSGAPVQSNEAEASVLFGQPATIGSPEEVFDAVVGDICHGDVDGLGIFVSSEILPEGSVITNWKGPFYTLQQAQWFVFIDDHPGANWEHPCRYMFVDPETGESQYVEATSPPNMLEDMIRFQGPDPFGGENLKGGQPSQEYRQSRSPEHLWAVILSGGYDSGNNHVRYWNDCSEIYKTLSDVYGYLDSQIIVAISDGLDPAVDQSNGQNSDPDLDGDGDDDIMYSCILSNVDLIFANLASTLGSMDTLFVFTTDHGSGTVGVPGPTDMNLWNHEILHDYHFAELCEPINCREIIVTMEPCFSGGFVDDFIGMSSTVPRVISTGANDMEYSWAMAPDYIYDTYVFHWTAAVRWMDAYGVPVDADTNSDTEITMDEAYNYALTMDTDDEHPQYGEWPVGFGSTITLAGSGPTSMGEVKLDHTAYNCSDTVNIVVEDLDLAGTGTAQVYIESNAETTPEAITLTETDTAHFEGSIATAIGTPSPDGVLQVNIADLITVTYNDADDGTGYPAWPQDTATADGSPPGSPSGLTVEWYGLVQQQFYLQDFEGDGTPTFGELGWTTGGSSNDWQIGTPAGLGAVPDPSAAYSGTHSIGNDLTGLGATAGYYENNLAANSDYVVSNSLSCAGYTDVQVRIARWLGVESATWDHVYVRVGTSPTGPWTDAWTNTGGTITDTSWSLQTYDISSVADNQASVYIRFDMGASDGSVTYCGWNIDDMALLGLTSGTMHNTLNWTLSSDDGAGANDVDHYNIYRSALQTGPWDASTLIDTVSKGTATYVDPDRGEFDGINWWYVVRAVDEVRNIEMNTNAVPEIPPTNVPPSAPSNPTPANGAIGVAINPTTLSVRAADPNGDLLTVSFYNAAGPVLIGTNYNVPSGTYTSVDWNGLVPTTTYSWYATAYDGEFMTQSSTWSFTTVDMTPPGPATGLTVEWWGVTFVTLIDEHFLTNPTDWTITHTAGTAWTWVNQRMENTYGLPNSGYLDSPVVDCSGLTGTTLSFWHYWQANYASGTQDGYVRGSIDGGSTWPYLVDEFHHNNPATEDAVKNYTIPWADGHSLVRIRYDIYNNNDWYWRIDDVLMTAGGGSTTEHNWLNWTLSADDGGGANDVDHYNIYRALAASGPWDATALIDTAPAGTATYMDLGRGEPDGINWWYVIRAEDIWGNEEMNTNAVPEISTGLTAYNIDLTGHAANSWVFVSFPHAVSGNIQDILNDAINGDGLTTWTRAMWYNPQTPADLWKTYRVGSTTNDLATISNLMGVWLWITANGGDQQLTLGVTGDYSATTVTVNLYIGWNLVGYPSATPRLGSATLPIQADRVSVWQAASPYIADSTPGSVTMSHGNAYWVHVTADCTWIVDP